MAAGREHVGVDDGPFAEAADRCAAARRLAVLCGAGLSAGSGVPTFRGADGLWRRHRPEELASPEAFARDPLLVWQWYAERQAAIARCAPNAGHAALAALLGDGREALVATQNVDGLQQRACAAAGVDPAGRLLELHGCLWIRRCTGCGAEDRRAEPLRVDAPADLPCCASCGALERPGVVWFGEALDMALLQHAARAAQACDVFLVAGTSGVVEPAASLARIASRAGACVIEVNPDETPLSACADLALRAPSEDALPRVLSLD